MAGFKELESIPPHRRRIQAFETNMGGRPVKIVDIHGELDPQDIDQNGKKIMKRVKEVGKRIVVEPIIR